MAHAFLAPSGAEVWGRRGGCRAYPLMTASYPESEESEEAREGTAAHWVAHEGSAFMLRLLPVPDLTGQTAPNGVVVAPAMVDAAKIYLEDIRGECIKSGIFAGPNVGFEVAVSMPQIHPLNAGTLDAFLHDPKARRLIVWDFKYGFSPVAPFENMQLIDYVAGLLDLLGIDGLAEQHYEVDLRIVQPRAFHGGGPVKSWRLRLTDLRPYFNDLALAAAECVNSAEPVARAARHCRNCSARHACPALREAAGTAMAIAQGIYPEDLPAAAVGTELTMLKWAQDVIDARVTGLETHAEHVIRSGGIMPGFSMKPGRSNKQWAVPLDEVFRLGMLYNIDLRQNKSITPTQAIAAGIPEDVIDRYSHRPAGSLRLTVDKENEAKRVFSK